jgi:lipopolysaccharide biosynthesis glycosyltransferase
LTLRLFTKKTYAKIIKTFEKYKSIHTFADQPTLNLVFNQTVKFLPIVYNFQVSTMLQKTNCKPSEIKAIVLHFTHDKPWVKSNPFYKEWHANLIKADMINLEKRPAPIKTWSKTQIENYLKFMKEKEYQNKHSYILYKARILCEKCIGLVGKFIKKSSPRLYRYTKKVLDNVF